STVTPLLRKVSANAAGAAIPANADRRLPASSEICTDRMRPASQHSAGTRVAVTTGTRGACSSTASATSRASPRSEAPVATTRSARERASSGSRSGPAGRRRPLPQGRRARAITISRSFLSVRCWKPSSRTIAVTPKRSIATRAASWRFEPTTTGIPRSRRAGRNGSSPASPGLSRVDPAPAAARPPRRLRPAAPAPPPARRPPPRGPGAERRPRLHRGPPRGGLAGAADSEIADGDHAARQGARLEDASPVEPLARAEEAAIAAAGDRQHTRRAGRKALLPAADETLARVHTRGPG